MNNNQLELLNSFEQITRNVKNEFLGRSVRITNDPKVYIIKDIIVNDYRVFFELKDFPYLVEQKDVNLIEEYTDNVIDFTYHLNKKLNKVAI